jgi:hypothetical protein
MHAFVIFEHIGRGIYTYPDGSKFEGEYKDDKPNGTGTQTSRNGSVLQDGSWSMGKFLGS